MGSNPIWFACDKLNSQKFRTHTLLICINREYEMKLKEKERAIYLRKVEGKSLGQIAKELGIAKSTASLWLKSIKLTKTQLKSLDKQNPAKKEFKGKRTVSEFNRKQAQNKRIIYQDIGRKDCKDFNLHLAGCMLYWAEGRKHKNCMSFTNTDPNMMFIFLRFLTELFGVSKEKIKICCRSHILSTKSLNEVERYWLDVLKLDYSNLRKGNVEIRIPKVKKVKYPNGICTITVNDTKLVQRIFGGIKEYIGLKDMELWLN